MLAGGEVHAIFRPSPVETMPLVNTPVRSSQGLTLQLEHLHTDDPEKCLSQQTSVHLRGLLWTALEAELRVILLEGVSVAGFPTYRFLQRLSFSKGVGVIASTSDSNLSAY